MSYRRDGNYYLIPPPFDRKTGQPADADAQFSWSREMVQAGKAFLKLQPAHSFIQDGLDIINGEFARSTIQALSNVKTELVVRNMKELNASQSNLNIVPAITTENEQFRAQTQVLNNCYTYWSSKTFSDRVIRKGWQYATGLGTGYVSIGYDPDYYGIRQGEIALRSHGPLDVLPLGLPHDHDLQKTYAVALRIPTPYHQAVRYFPEMADKIHPTRDSLKQHGTVMAQSVKFASAVLKRFGPGATQEQESLSWAETELYYIFIDDRTENWGPEPILMGDPGTSWEYEVPYVGQMIYEGTDSRGRKHYRKAKPEDCLVYPYRRMMVCTDDAVLNPDPTLQVNHGWHAKVPVVQFRADDWPWNFLGFPLSKAGMLLEKANIEILRAMVDAMNVRLSPPTGYDRNTMARSLAETMNLRIPNQRIGLDYTLGGEQFRPLLPVEFYNVPANAQEMIQANEARITHQMGVADATALARARQLPAGDSTERLLDALGPIIKDQSRNMELSVTQLGDMWVPLCFQWWNAAKRFRIFGVDGLVDADVDWNPGNFVPQTEQDRLGSYFEAGRQHASIFHYGIEPYSLHELNSLTRKMVYMQLERGGFPISWWTLARIWGIKNFGPKPRDTNPASPTFNKEYITEFELWLAEQEMKARFAQAGAQAGGPRPGRKPTGQQPPTLQSKGGGTRSTVRESPR